eukprot:gb/GECG01007657.1/.p1 GENE.gb/GECG01007657.1/~~gb/GECG01007657.1/.p1  ORF type:complete len:120 (+),score=16.27 gb/GECG01007657.1/:1-360(+)
MKYYTSVSLTYATQASKFVNPRALRPLSDRVLVKRIIPEAKTAGGVLLPESNVKTNTGEVLSVGPGAYTRDGNRIPPTLKEGDKVMLPEFGGHKVPAGEDQEESYVLFREEDILGKIEE